MQQQGREGNPRKKVNYEAQDITAFSRSFPAYLMNLGRGLQRLQLGDAIKSYFGMMGLPYRKSAIDHSQPLKTTIFVLAREYFVPLKNPILACFLHSPFAMFPPCKGNHFLRTFAKKRRHDIGYRRMH
jgi:hypothetical protein